MHRCRIFKHCTAYISAISQQIELKFGAITLEVKRINSRDKTRTLQHCSIPCSVAESLNTLQPISQPFFNGLSWNFAWWLSSWEGSSIDLKQWPCSTAAFHAALQNLWTLNSLSQLFLNVISWDLACWYFRWKGSSSYSQNSTSTLT